MSETVGRWRVRHPAGSKRKRVLDVAGALAILIFYAPVMTLLMLGTRLKRGGPVLEREETVGLGGRMFGRWRFRPPAEDDVCADIIERSGLTYLPSAINVLAGDMSLVGPEPHGPERSRYLRRGNSDYERRFEARPGLIWPRAEDGRSALIVELAYLAEWRTRLDLKIMGLHAFDGLFGATSEVG